MKIALLVPSRERLTNKRTLIESVRDTAEDLGRVRLYLGTDTDDPCREETYAFKDEFPFVTIVDIMAQPSFPGLGYLWNVCAANSSEEIISMIGDDMAFRTKGWDARILEQFSPSKCPADNIKMVHCNDLKRKEKLAVNLFIHRDYMKHTGYFMREEFKINWIDLWLHQIYSSIGRRTYLPDVVIEHLHWSLGKMPVDSVVKNLKRDCHVSESSKTWEALYQERLAEASMLGRLIGVTPDFKKITRGRRR